MSASSRKKKIQQKKRRSSFVRGRSRKSLPPTDIACADLHKTIPTDIPEPKRLYQLQEKCFEFTMQKLRSECPAIDGWELFQEQASQAFKFTVDKLESDGILDRVCSRANSEGHPNPENESLKKAIADIQDYTKKLTDEGNKWEELIHTSTEETEAAERTLANPQPHDPILEPPASLSNNLKTILSSLSDLGEMTDWARRSADKLQLQVDCCQKGSHQMASFAKDAGSYVSKQIQILANKSAPEAPVDPMALIQGASSDTAGTSASSHHQ